MGKIKGILKIWLFKYWYFLVLCLALSYGFFYFLKHEKHEQIYICKMQGSTFMLSRLSLNEYMEPLSQSLTEKDYYNAERFIGVDSMILKKIKTILFDAQPIIEETNIRYEYRITITADDTIGFYLLENALINRMCTHILVQENYQVKLKKFEKDKFLIQTDLKRIDSIVSTIKNKQTEYYETLMQRKVDMQLQLSKLEGKFNENYIHKKIYDFRVGTTVIDRSEDGQKVSLFKWILVFITIDFVLVFVIDKHFRQLIIS
jgi:hypothetical protein